MDKGSLNVDSPLLTSKQAADALACTEAAIRKWIAQRRLAAVKVGRLTRIRPADLEKFIEASGQRPSRLR